MLPFARRPWRAPKVGGVLRPVMPTGRTRRVLLVLAGVVVVVVAVTAGANVWVAASSHGRVADGATDTIAGDGGAQVLPSAPVGLVLGAGVQPDGNPSPYLKGRLDLAVALFRSGRVKVLLVSGDNRTSHYDEPTAMYTYLVAAGIPADKVVRDFAGRDTYASCVRARRIFGADQVLLISQTYHLPRAVATCRAVGLDAVGVGDSTVKMYAGTWRWGRLREIPAAVKAVIDVLSHRKPILGQPEPGLHRALGES